MVCSCLPARALACACAGEARWDVRMTAWLLYVRAVLAPRSALWARYLSLLPSREGAPCLLNYDEQHAAELQVCTCACGRQLGCSCWPGALAGGCSCRSCSGSALPMVQGSRWLAVERPPSDGMAWNAPMHVGMRDAGLPGQECTGFAAALPVPLPCPYLACVTYRVWRAVRPAGAGRRL